MSTSSDSKAAPDLSGARRERSTFKLSRASSGTYYWDVSVVAEDDSPEAIRQAVEVAFEIDDYVFGRLKEHLTERRERHKNAKLGTGSAI